MTMQKTKKRAFDNKDSRVKLVVYDNMNQQKSFYSFLRDDRKGYEYTMKAMTERILGKYYGNKFQTAIFYNTISDTVIKHINTNEVAQKVNKSKVKMIVYDKTNARQVYYNHESTNKMSVDYHLGEMSSMLFNKYANRYNVAMLYDMEKDQEIMRRTPWGIVEKKA
ncbi:hypothetical protein [Saccharicrinis aurantiacus]|uniref:hypothetical protein n=1 Tax=Saccharicrinis aurantiacus TaxID=1849719 RepID=UPI00094F4C21|nr:hypothetical protein [Saccharicrinis aurantiacus]